MEFRDWKIKPDIRLSKSKINFSWFNKSKCHIHHRAITIKNVYHDQPCLVHCKTKEFSKSFHHDNHYAIRCHILSANPSISPLQLSPALFLLDLLSVGTQQATFSSNCYLFFMLSILPTLLYSFYYISCSSQVEELWCFWKNFFSLFDSIFIKLHHEKWLQCPLLWILLRIYLINW